MNLKSNISAGFCLALLFVLAAARPAFAFIEKMYALDEMLKEATHVVVGTLGQVDEKAKTAVLVTERSVKGPLDFKKVNLNIALGPGPHARFMIDRIQPGMPAILYYKVDGNNVASLLHVGDHWYQFYATDDAKNRDKIWWRMTHVEIRMNRTFDGKTTDLIKLTEDVLAKRVPSPKPDPKVPPIDVNKPAFLAVKGGRTNGFFRQIQLGAADASAPGNIAVNDVNGDGLPDALFCRPGGNLLLINQGGTYKELARETGLQTALRGAVFADFDGDGQADLLGGDFKLWRNLGSGKFKEDSALLSAPAQRSAQHLLWLDADGDGWPDIVAANGGDGVRLWQNPGNGKDRFREVSDNTGFGSKGLGAGTADSLRPLDFDGDGWPDLFHATPGGGLLARNERGQFKAWEKSGLALPKAAANLQGMAAADFDNDGDWDLLVPLPTGVRLYRNENDGTFTNIARRIELSKVSGPVAAAAWGDVNGDGAPDLVLCQPKGSTLLFLGNGAESFMEMSGQLGVEGIQGASAANLADLDGDGDLDLLVNARDKVVVAFNDVPKRAERRALTVQTKVRRGGCGATVRVLDKDGRLMGLRDAAAAHFHLPPGEYRVYVALSDGRLARKVVTLKPDQPHLPVAIEENDCQ